MPVKRKGHLSFPCTCQRNSSDPAKPYHIFLAPGSYLVELWGADGASNYQFKGGKGGYVQLYLDIYTTTEYYITVGGSTISSNVTMTYGGCNGGGNSYPGDSTGRADLKFPSGGGGGSTSISTGLTNESRIAVAAGGGGVGGYTRGGGNAGGLIAPNIAAWSFDIVAEGGNQTHGGKGGRWNGYIAGSGTLLYGGDGTGISYTAGGGGGGLYGGGGNYEGSGAGGSSAIIKPYRGKIFAGGQNFRPPPIESELYQPGDGFALITAIDMSCPVRYYAFNYNILYVIILITIDSS